MTRRREEGYIRGRKWRLSFSLTLTSCLSPVSTRLRIHHSYLLILPLERSYFTHHWTLHWTPNPQGPPSISSSTLLFQHQRTLIRFVTLVIILETDQRCKNYKQNWKGPWTAFLPVVEGFTLHWTWTCETPGTNPHGLPRPVLCTTHGIFVQKSRMTYSSRIPWHIHVLYSPSVKLFAWCLIQPPFHRSSIPHLLEGIKSILPFLFPNSGKDITPPLVQTTDA